MEKKSRKQNNKTQNTCPVIPMQNKILFRNQQHRFCSQKMVSFIFHFRSSADEMNILTNSKKKLSFTKKGIL